MACVRRVEELREYPDFVRYYDYEESHKQDLEASYDTGLEQEVKQGIESSKQKELEIARAMLSDGDSIDKVSRITGLSIEKINSIVSSFLINFEYKSQS